MFIDSSDNGSPLRRSEISANRAPTERKFIRAPDSINIWPLRGLRLHYPPVAHSRPAPQIYPSAKLENIAFCAFPP
jgi:hypothetical protein